MTRILDFLQNITIGPAERHRRTIAAQEKAKEAQPDVSQSLKNIRQRTDKMLAYPLFCIAMSAKSKLDKCEPLLREIADLNHEQPVPLELRMAVKECLREIEKEDALCP